MATSKVSKVFRACIQLQQQQHGLDFGASGRQAGSRVHAKFLGVEWNTRLLAYAEN